MVNIIKEEGLYESKFNSSLVSTCNCKMGYCNIITVYDGNLNSSFLLIIHNSFQPKEKEILFDLLFFTYFSIATVAELDQKYILTAASVRDSYLVYILREHAENKSVIIFTHTCKNCQTLANMLWKCDLPCVALHSLKSQGERLAGLATFKSGLVKILVATDVASRGLDIPQVELVINSNVPASPKDYIHRVGRTARAGRGGMAITLMTQYDVDRVKQIEATINTKLVEFETNENEALPLLRAVMMARREAQLKVRSSAVLEKRMINKRKKMLLEGKDPDVKAVKRKRRQKKLTEKVKNK